MLASSVAMIFFVKINKKSFYNHYFKGIVDIELRNSQAIDLNSSIGVYALPDLKPIVLSLFWLGISLLLGILTRIIPLNGPFESLSATPHADISFYKLAFATRAP